MSFIWPWMLLTLFLLPLFVWSYFHLVQKRRRAVQNLGMLSLGQINLVAAAGRKRHVPPSFFFFGLALLLFGSARPEVFVRLPHLEGTVILAFDVSKSMAAEDFEPSRIEAAKTAARNFVNNQPSTLKLGVVAFSNGGLVVQPPTTDRGEVLAAIERLNPEGATSLGQGIFSALNAIAGEALSLDHETLENETPQFDIEDYSSAVVLLLTDGENTSSPDPLEVAQLAAEAGVRIYPLGIGSAEGTVLEIEGFNVLTQLNEPALQDIASLTNGAYYRAEDGNKLQDIYNDVDLQLEVGGEKMEATSIFAGVSLLFFLVAGILSLVWFGRIP